MRKDYTESYGLDCQEGTFDDCFQEDPMNIEHVPAGCDHVLIFSKSNLTCGSNCYRLSRNVRPKTNIVKEGWTLYMR